MLVAYNVPGGALQYEFVACKAAFFMGCPVGI
jgi:hypothetical protein